MKTKNKVQFFIVSILLLVFAIGCENMEDTYKEFIGSGETTYIGKADSIKTRGGKNRLELSWLLLSDPKVSSYKVYWNNKADSIEGKVVKTTGVDTVKVMFDNIDEGEYQFDIYLFDNDRNSSVRSSKRGEVYGSRYENSLLNRTFESAIRDDEDLIVDWMPAENGVVMVELEYIDSSNKTIKKQIAGGADLDTLFNFPLGGTFSHRTLFLPNPFALDMFHTSLTTFQEEVIPPPTPVGEWLFNNPDNLLEATFGSALKLVGSHQLIDGPKEGNKAIRIGKGSHYIVNHGIKPKGGQMYVNEYSILFDIKATDLGIWRALLQTNPSNSDDAELFIRPGSGSMGNSNTGYTSTGFTPEKWHRLIVSVKNGFEYSLYLDTEKILTGNIQLVDSKFALQPTFLLFGDEDGDDGNIDVARVALYDFVLKPEDIIALGIVKK